MKHNSTHVPSGHSAPATPALSSRGVRSNSRRFSTFAACLLAATAFGQVAAHAATITVTTAADTGAGSLRQAITDANASAGVADTINFNISGMGVQTITLATALPTISDAVTIDGYSQPGSSANTLAVGNNAVILIEVTRTAGTSAPGFSLGAANCSISGLSLGNFTAGILLNNGATNTTVKGNYIGVRADGITRLANTSFGVQCVTAGNTIGGSTPADRNVISGNNGNGISFAGSSSNNIVKGNYIGTDASGNNAIGNAGTAGILVQGPGAGVNTLFNNTIGGTTPGERNVISGNAGPGIYILNDGLSGTQGNTVKGNYIGTNASGNAALGNSFGVQIRNASNNTIGGTTAGEGNLISNNRSAGITVSNGSATLILATRNAFRGNSISANDGLGIDLRNGLTGTADGVTLNDVGDADGIAANLLQNFPVLTSVDNSGVGGNGVITGTLNSTASSTFTIDFYDNAAADPTGYGEGQTYLGSQTVTTDGSGNGTFTLNLTSPLTSGRFVSATATDSANNTSEFSFARPFGPNTAPRLNNATITTPVNVAFSQQLAGSDAQNDTLVYSLAAGSTLPATLTLSSAGLITGTPTTAGNISFSVDVTDGTATTTAKFIIVVSSAADGLGPVVTRPAFLASYTRDELAALSYTGTIKDVAQGTVLPTGVSRLLFQLRQGNTSYSGPTDGFTPNVGRGYYAAFLDTPTPNTTAGNRLFRRTFSTFIPPASVLTPGSYSIVIAAQDVAGNYSVEVVPVTITASAPAARMAPFGVSGSANGS